jgi:predicted small secreted protein
MKMKKRIYVLASLLMAASLLLSGCGSSAKKPVTESG